MSRIDKLIAKLCPEGVEFKALVAHMYGLTLPLPNMKGIDVSYFYEGYSEEIHEVFIYDIIESN